ncbi:MAG: basic secretory protein [Verrucomicrobiales bacterium]|nr:basic secretory protein [Verrucomicrobiales bacterium]
MTSLTLSSHAEVKVTIERNPSDLASASFKFKNVPSPSRTDAGGSAKFTVIEGARDRNGGTEKALHDGKLPGEDDQPSANFFFSAGANGGRLLAELGAITEIKQVNSYSWHAGTRGPQVYKLYGADGKAEGFLAEPKKGTDAAKAGWTFIAAVDTRPKGEDFGGQYGVSIADESGPIGKYKYLLFDISQTEEKDPFGNTFYSEIDIIDPTEHAVAAKAEASTEKVERSFEADGGKYKVTIDSTAAPDLKDWAYAELAPVATNWYPKLVAMLPSEGYEAPKNITILFREGMGKVPASASGAKINCNIDWFRKNVKGEARGSVVHEMVHVVQQYAQFHRMNPNGSRTPGWLVEGIPDYIRWYLYEPQTRGAEISKGRLAAANYDSSYRVTGNFLNWVTEKYSSNMVQSLNAAARQGKYSEDIWKEKTGKTVQELGGEWKQALAAKLNVNLADTEFTPKDNTLSAAETKAGWKLLFDGKDLNGWHNFKREGIRAGWQVKDGTLACVDPHDAGDIVTTEKFEWFELQLDYNISEGGNSGIMFHVTDEGGAAWATGPEIQLEDNAKAADPQRCGWLYGLYKPETDPKTGKPLDATKPAGEWNHVRILISAEKCVHEINGVKYFEYVLGSDDFNERVAKSKFGKMPRFAKASTGYLALQGDHGQVSFRNIKVRPITAGKEQ